MKKFCTVLDRLLTPWSILAWTLPVEFSSAEKYAILKVRTLSMTLWERSLDTKMRILSP